MVQGGVINVAVNLMVVRLILSQRNDIVFSFPCSGNKAKLCVEFH